MQRFILEQNIVRFRRLLAEKTDETSQRTLQSLLLAARRNLAFLDTAARGVDAATQLEGSRNQFVPDPDVVSQFQHAFGRASHPSLAIDPGPGLHIVDMNTAYAEVTMTARTDVIGKPLFEIFPDNPNDTSADGVSNLYTSLCTAWEAGKPHSMPIQRYDVRNRDGQFVERFWRPINTPMLNDQGRSIYILHQVEDVTREVLSSKPAGGNTGATGARPQAS